MLDIYLPFADVYISIIILLLIGFCVGVLGSFFGVGGAFVVTPALNIFGFPMAYAIGTDLAFVSGKSFISSIKHRFLGNVDIKLGVLMIFGTLIGVWIGKEIIISLEEVGTVDSVVRVAYIIILITLALYMIHEHYRFSKGYLDSEGHERLGTAISKKIQKIRIPPMISLPTSHIQSISLWVIIGVGFATGFLAGFLGVGGGFIRMPALIYIIGTPTTVAIGTDLLEIIFSSGFGAFIYGMEGRVDIVAAGILLLGASIGVEIGVNATRYIKGMSIRLYFAITILFAGISVVFKQISAMYGIELLSIFAGTLILGVAGMMTLIVITGLIKGIIEEKHFKVVDNEE